MASAKWICLLLVFAQMSNKLLADDGGMVFPDSDENSFDSYRGKFFYGTSGVGSKSSGGQTMIKTSQTSTRFGQDVEPAVMNRHFYQTGSSAQANAGASSFNYNNPGYFNVGPAPSGSSSGSYASASSSSFSSGIPCQSQPKAPPNGKLSCSSSACQVICLPDYKFPNGESSMLLGCMNGRWMVKSLEWNDIPACEPVCTPACRNNGICVAPGQCDCPSNFMGPTCQHAKKLCLSSPPLPANAKRSCTQSLCSVTCIRGYKFPDGTLTMNLQCINTEWVPVTQGIRLIPDCEPICDLPCMNGGNCLSYNVCQCTKDFRGPQCQWGTERCATTLMKFNGGLECSGSAASITCKLKCPASSTFEYQPADIYTCTYATGGFLPAKVPRCVFPPGAQVIQSGLKTQYNEKNATLIRKQGGRRIVEEDGDDENETIVETKTVVKTTITRTKKGKRVYAVDEDEEFFEAPGLYSLFITQDVEMTIKTPKPSICMAWNGNKIKTFDGLTYLHSLVCSHTLVQDIVDGTFSIILRACPYEAIQPCPHALEVFIQNEQYTFENEAGAVRMYTTRKELPIPVQLTGLKVTRSGTDVRIVLEQIPITITWDSNRFVQIDTSESIWNRTAGLCGTMDGIMSNDFMSKDGVHHKMASTFVDSWRAINLDKNKEKCIPRSQPITAIQCETSIEEKANLVCVDLLANRKMTNCFAMLHKDILMSNCVSDYCNCKNSYERTECICNGIAALAKECSFRNVQLQDGWRDWQICPLNCTNGRVYKSCGPLNEPSCGSAIESDSFNCREGCFCPEGSLLNDGVCVKLEHCPCRLKGRAFPPNSQIKRDCNTCTCSQGNWKCSSITCGSRCAAVGDPHYSTFDGKHFDFMGKCSYYLMKAEGITVEAENVACSGAISENMNFLPSVTTELPSCTKSLTIRFNDNAGQQRVIKLKQGGVVQLDGLEVSKLPRELSNGAVIIRRASSSFVIVDFQDGASVWWDGATRAYIDAPPSYRGKTQGLCGTFNSNMQDDFLTPEGDIETTVHPFANKWQTKDSCDFLSDKIVPHPCQVNVGSKAKADKVCGKLRDKVFADCHLFVDPEQFYEDCLYDVCACQGDISHCSCPIFAAYASECARQGTVLEWRYKVSECAISCPNGQVFQQCGEACTRTCSDLQSEVPCKLQCVEGCRCPLGQVLDEDGECVTVAMCKCVYKNMEFKPSYKEVRPGRKFQELCTCHAGKWSCVEATGDDANKYPAAGDMSKKCAATRNEVFTTCEPAEPITCKNMHAGVSTTTASCRPGCKCKDGYVLDTMLKVCVLPEQCSCHHGGKSYSEGETMKEDCNTCTCKAAKWQCTKQACGSTCSAWGDSHFTTFDGREFDFQGVCSYVLAKGKLPGSTEGFSVMMQNVLCGSNGVTCSKSLELNLVGDESESIQLSSDQAVPGFKGNSNAKPQRKMLTYRSGVFIIVELPHIGVLLKWDRGTRVYLKLEPRWKGHVQGLCGNYNYDALDDFMNPSLGIESNAIVFGHSWKLEDSCAVPTEQVDSCALNPQRMAWAQRKCGLLKTSEFAQCHSAVSVESFYRRCIFDSCSCDQGGDCECLCTALSAYAYECSSKGVSVKWRTPDLCPMQCDPTCSNYSPCIAACPPDTCDNLMHPMRSERLCSSDVCVEGCKLKDCPEGTVYNNSSYMDCVPKSLCKPVCLVENGKTFYEGDVMSSDECHSCKCSRGGKTCSGAPCALPMKLSGDGGVVCTTGWSGWMNQDSLDQSNQQNLKTSKMSYFKEDDIEPLPNKMQMMKMTKGAVCLPDNFAAVECQSVVGHHRPKQTNQNAECSLERGLVCLGQCFDYEIRVYCECGDVTPNPLNATTLPSRPPLNPVIPIVPPITTTPASLMKLCDPNIPNVEHPSSCSMYLQCVLSQKGSYVYIEKTCGPSTMFNPKSMVCDHEANVKAINPKCATWPPPQPPKTCPPGYSWSDCALPCNRACNYYKNQLNLAGNCSYASPDCIGGCMPSESALTCEYPKRWRDWQSCVDLQSCTCVGPSNEILKPGQVVYISECKTCQCLNNEFICADVPCARQPSTLPPKVVTFPTQQVLPPDQRATLKIPSYITICDPSIPHIEHPNSCYKFLHCVPTSNGSYIYAIKNCYPDMMFNPKSMVCDWPASVKAMKPKCAINPGETEDWETKVVTTIDVDYIESNLPYYIRICDPTLPVVEHPESCYKYLECLKLPNGSYAYTEQTCGRDKMYNKFKKNCDLPASVIKGNPKCRDMPGVPETLNQIKVTTQTPTDYVGGGSPKFIRECDPKVPLVDHPESCYKYLQCQQMPNGIFTFVEQTCGAAMMFNPNAMVCDWPSSVKAIKPVCQVNPGLVEVIPYVTTLPGYSTTVRPGLPAPKLIESTQRPLISVPSQQTTLKPAGGVKIPSYITICDPSIPHIEHPNSCYKFLHCTPSLNGSYIYAIKNCYPDMMFNPKSMVCDWPASVKAMKPKCAINPGETEDWETKVVTTIDVDYIESNLPYYIRNCDPALPVIEHPESCYKYLECLKLANGSYFYKEQTCGMDMMYNKFKKDCDWPADVIKGNPKCAKTPGVSAIPTLSPTRTTQRPFVPTEYPIIVPNTLTPPSPCDGGQMVPLLDLLPDSAFSASSTLSGAFKPEFSRLESRPTDNGAGSWAPKANNLNQYLEVTFPKPIPVHAVTVRGNPMMDQYVTSFKILHSYDGSVFHVLQSSTNQPKIFSGSTDPKTPVKTIFDLPIEAKILRIYPLTWHSSIALRAEFWGCQQKTEPMFFVGTTRPTLVTTQPPVFVPPPVTVEPIYGKPVTSFTEAPIVPMCDDELGVLNNKLSPSQVMFSSIKDSGSVKTKVRKNSVDIVKLSSPRGWMPLTDSTNEFILFNFLESRNLTGFITKGGEYGWVKAFAASYSHDNVIWNAVTGDDGKRLEFLANVDSETVKKNLFRKTINAQYLKIQPSKWYGAIELKVEPLGCFKPYPKITDEVTSRPTDEVEIITPSTCGVCKGVPRPRPVDVNSCVCNPPLYWSGSECVPQTQCPCVEGHLSYEVGGHYKTENCSDCVCKIGGVPDCKPNPCPPCKTGLRREQPQSCSCKCVKCPPGTVICPTSGECVSESAWCDGIEDCPDDEKYCSNNKLPSVKTNRTETIVIEKKCPDPSCPPGFVVTEKQKKKPRMRSRFSDSDEDDDHEDDQPQRQYYYIKAKYQTSYEAVLPISTSAKKQDINSEECIQFMCIPTVEEPDYSDEDEKPIQCPEPKCSRDFMIRLQVQKNPKECAKFSCEPILDNDAVCNITGRTFSTFDTTEFKYDVCSHLLARDIADIKWNVIMRKNCSTGNNICSKEIEIKDKVSKYTLILYPSLSVNLDGYYFTVQQLQYSNRKMPFTVSKNGDNLLFVSHPHGIWLTFDQYGDVKLGISSQYVKSVDGLCGFFSNDKTDDKRTPAGKLAASTVEFGDSWSVGQMKDSCEPHVCPKALQDVAWTMCNLVKDETFKTCHSAIDPTHFISKCMETACDCLLAAANGSTTAVDKYAKQCKCSMLKNYVVECMAADESVHLETWRSVHSCEASCPVPFVHHDCFRRKCETTCNNLQSSECTAVPGTCFSGCYCPSGTVRKDATCIPISECRDCVCDGFGKSQYLTFDRKNFTFDGNCTYLLTRDVALTNIHTFQVYATIGPCDAKADGVGRSAKLLKRATCTQALHMVYGDHIVHIQKGATGMLEILVDGLKLKSLPHNLNWIKISEQSKTLSILLPESQVELVSMFETMSFSIKVPSVKYANKLQGICGNCNGNPNDDLITNPAKTNLPNNLSPLEQFAMSWLAEEPKLALNENRDQCYVDETENFMPLPPETDPCLNIFDDEIFGQCHFVVEPMMYITACQQDLARTGPSQKGSCESVAAYARECARNGVCLAWRKNGFCTMDCAAPFVYDPCGCGETCKTIEDREKMIRASTALKDPTNIGKLRSICSTPLQEGCFCPKGSVLHNGKCLREAECRACDDKGHLPGDVWYPDVCTSCSCRNDSTIQCQKTECPSQGTICQLGYNAVETASTGQCCKKYACVPAPMKTTMCPPLTPLRCSANQENKIIIGPDGCDKSICDCVAKEKCKPLQNETTTQAGFKTIIDTTGCCPVSKLVCDKSLCPRKPSQCTEAFYVLEKTKTAGSEVCCDEYECRAPPNNCVATVGSMKVLKKLDESWPTEDVCVKAACAFDTNGNPIIKTQREVCNAICQPGFELKSIPNKCCGECIKTKCVVDGKLYAVGVEWSSSDNCTTFACNIKDGQTFVSSMMPTCSDVSQCPPAKRYFDGCCEKCKLEPSAKLGQCFPESLAETLTVGLIQVVVPPHGKCKNLNAVRGITQCAGSCNSGTTFDPSSLQQLKACDCCSVSETREIQVELICEDKSKLVKLLSVPAACSCSKCSNADAKLLKLTASS